VVQVLVPHLQSPELAWVPSVLLQVGVVETAVLAQVLELEVQKLLLFVLLQ